MRWIAAIFVASTAAADQSMAPLGNAPTPLPEAGAPREWILDVTFERSMLMSRFTGQALLAAADPRFVIVVKVDASDPAGAFPEKRERAFAVHSLAQLGMSGIGRGDTIRLSLRGERIGERVVWTMRAVKPS